MNFNLKNISTFSIVRDLIYNIWVVALACFVAIAGSYIYVNYYHELTYSATMTVSVNQKNTTATTAASVTKTVETASIFQTLFKSEVMKSTIEEVTGEPMTGSISTNQITSTNLIQLTATSSSPQGAFLTLSAVYNNYRAVTDYAFEDVVIYVLNYPTVPLSPSNAVSVKSTAMKCVPIVFIAVSAIIVLLSILRDTVKTEYSIKNDLCIDTIYGSIYHERKNKTLKTFLKKKNKRIILTDPLVNKSYKDSFKSICMKLERLNKTDKKSVFAIASTNENEGKTTVAINTALTLALNGHKVLLMDLDLRKPSVWRFFNNIDFESKGKQISEIIKSGMFNAEDFKMDKDSGLYLLAGKKNLTHSSEYLTHSSFRLIMEKLRQYFDYIIIDTPPLALIADAEIISASSDGVLLVVRQDNSAIDAITDTITSFNLKSSVLGCIFNDVKTIPGFITGNYGLRKSHYGSYY